MSEKENQRRKVGRKMANLRNIRKWVKLLRSGKFKQIKGALYKDGGYCCLGVACVAAGMKRKGNKFGMENAFLPLTVRRRLGIDVADPYLGDMSATRMNDKGMSFATIADAIERKFLTKSKPDVG